MIKKKRDEAIKGNGNDPDLVATMSQLVTAIESQNKSNKELADRVEELEHRKDSTGQAQLFIAQRVFDTDPKHLPEMTKLAVRSVRTYSLADMSASILDPLVQCGLVTLNQVRRESVYRHMRSVGGDLLNKGAELAMEQMRSQEAQEPYEEANLGKGL